MKLKMKIEKLTTQLKNTTHGTKLYEAIASQIVSLQDVVTAKGISIKADISRQSANILRKNAMRVQKTETKQTVKDKFEARYSTTNPITLNPKMND